MNRLIIIVFTLVIGCPLITNGQSNPKFVYCEIVGFKGAMTTKITVMLDFGQRMKTFADNRMKDKDGKALPPFNTMVDALNFMADQGWEFVQAYSDEYSNQGRAHFLLKKSFDELDEETKKEFLKN